MSFLQVGGALHSDKYRPDIDGIRSIAVASVVICHAFPQWLPGGFVGVDIFFVLSGYLISSIILRDLDNNKFSIANFYNRRVRRIFPALVSVLLFTIGVGWFTLFNPEFRLLGSHITASTLFSENFLLWSESGYFDISSKLKPTLHLWSLAIEEQFYIFWPLLMYLAYRLRLHFAIMIVLLAGISFAFNIWDVWNDPTAAYYSPLGRSWELMVGAMLAYLTSHQSEVFPKFKNAQSIFGVLLITIALVALDEESKFPGFWALLPTFGTFLLIAAGEKAIVNKTILSSSPMVWCGLISYPLYLWHWVFQSYGQIIIGNLYPKRAIILVLLSVIAAVFTFFVVERPFRKRGDGNTKTFALLGMMVLVLCIGIIIAMGTLPSRLSGINVPELKEASKLSHEEEMEIDGISARRFGANKDDMVLMIGDSHAGHYAMRINEVIDTSPESRGLVMISSGGCIPILNVKTDDVSRENCWPRRERAFELAEKDDYEAVALAGAWNWYFIDSDYYYQKDEKRLPLISPEGRLAAVDQLMSQIKKLIEERKKVFLVLDNPASGNLNPFGRGNRLALKKSSFNQNGKIKIDSSQMKLQMELKNLAEDAGAIVIDTWSSVCEDNYCLVTDNDRIPLYKDQGHFSGEWIKKNGNFIDKLIVN